MKHVDGQKIQYVIKEVYNVFEKNKVTGQEASMIAGIINLNAAVMVLKKIVEDGEI